MSTIDLSRVPEYYHRYIKYVSETDLSKVLQKHQVDLLSLLTGIPGEEWDYRYAEGKWSIKELVQHIIDAERIFCYRALRFARRDKTELPGFDENSYAEASNAGRRTKEDLIDELSIIQKSSAQLFASFDDKQLNESGMANGKSVYVEAIGFIIAGHSLHHRKILLDNYLPKKTIHA